MRRANGKVTRTIPYSDQKGMGPMNALVRFADGAVSTVSPRRLRLKEKYERKEDRNA